jgi:hypothetical protein
MGGNIGSPVVCDGSRATTLSGKSAPMKYPNGVEVRIGDKVRFERGGASGTVEAIIEANFTDWSVEEPGVMLLSAPFGRVFIPVLMFVSDDVAPE